MKGDPGENGWEEDSPSLIDFFEMSRDAFFVFNRQFKVRYINPGARLLFKLRTEEVIGKALWQICPVCLESSDKYRQSVREGIPQFWQSFCKGTKRWMETSVTPLGNGEFTAAIRDITEKKRYKAFMESCFTGIFRADAGLKDYPSERVHPDDRAPVAAAAKQAIRNKEPIDMEFRAYEKDGGVSWYRARAVPLFGINGEIVEWVGSANDITVRQRVRQLAMELRRANAHKGDYISTLSHELRNPLAAISMAISLMEHVTPGSEQDVRARKIIKSQTDQLVKLVDGLLNVAGIKRNDIKLERKIVDVRKMLGGVIRGFRPRFSAKGVVLEEEYDPGAMYIDADPAWMRQAVGSLLSNALKFTEEGGIVRLVVSKDKNMRDVLIRVSDTGVGIDPGLLPDLFQSFVQADNSPARGTGGLGLGLPIAKGIIDLHGGLISVQSEPGKGAKFIIKLPLLQITL